MLLSDFHVIRPRYETAQEKGLEWFINAHIQAEKTRGLEGLELAAFADSIRSRILQFGCKPDRIAKRGHVLGDFLHQNWDEMEIYRLLDSPSGKGLKERTNFFQREIDALFEQYYADETSAPHDLIHVSCTGYVAPNAAQKIISKKNWGALTTVTNAYHMGCYGALPAIRMAWGFLAQSDKKERADIVHSEVCCIHSNPSKHEADQIITQSLFADGFIKYTARKTASGPHILVHSVREQIIPDSMDAMTWDLSDWGFQMSLAKEVPVLIVRALGPFLQELMQGIDADKALFAVHPGGPKIIDQVQKCLNLRPSQVAHSSHILKTCGNMSSATIPHIWDTILRDEDIADRTPIVSLAFGPGLTIAGALMEKRCGS